MAENGLKSDLRVYNLIAGACPRSSSKCVLTLSVPMLCPHNLLILATPLYHHTIVWGVISFRAYWDGLWGRINMWGEHLVYLVEEGGW